MLETTLSQLPSQFRKAAVPASVLNEAKKRVLDSLGCFYGAYNLKPGRSLRQALIEDVTGPVSLWGTNRRVPAELAAWANGTCVRTLDYNDTYLSKEPCHPSDLIACLWAACELTGAKNQGTLLLKAMILGYEVMCRLCDANSIRVRGWDHVTYLPIASAVACSYIYGLTPEQTRHAIALAVVGNNALRQTRVGTISDWKAACAAYAARSGLSAVRLASEGFTGPSDIFSGKLGFFNQVSGKFDLSKKPLGKPWKIMDTHTKFFPAEHHAQSGIEAAIELRPQLKGHSIRGIVIETFDVAVSIIGSEKEKWFPTTRETADHSMPYMIAAALLDGDVTLRQYEQKRFLKSDVRALMKKTTVKNNAAFSRMYPKKMPTTITVVLEKGKRISCTVLLPKGYAGRPMSVQEVTEKFQRLSAPVLSSASRSRLIKSVLNLERLGTLKKLDSAMRVK